LPGRAVRAESNEFSGKGSSVQGVRKIKRFAIILVVACAFVAVSGAARPLLAGPQGSSPVACGDQCKGKCGDTCKCDGKCCDKCKDGKCDGKCCDKCKNKDGGCKKDGGCRKGGCKKDGAAKQS